MAVPKRRQSKARTRSRRANWRSATPNVSSCPQCGSARRPHYVCPSCGHYGGRQAIEATEDSED